MTAFIKRGDLAQEFLIPFLRESETLLKRALRQHDQNAECRIVPAADLCIPHDVIRLAGGFATGCLVEWSSVVPVVPVDTTMNIDTSSIFIVSEDIRPKLTEIFFRSLADSTNETSSYVWNFDKGNHFISFCRRRSDNKYALILHSNEKEFKYQSNGLIPVEGNWFWDDIHTFREGSRYMRLLVGPKASHFSRLSKMLEEYNVLRHQFFFHQICGSDADLINESHDHHYFMPSTSSAALGVYVTEPAHSVPVFSKLGRPISIFRPVAGGPNAIRLGGQEKLLVPHGWGKTCRVPLHLAWTSDSLLVNGRRFPNIPKASIGKHPDLQIRDFADEHPGESSFFRQIEEWCPGEVVDVYDQVVSYTQSGVTEHH